MSESMQIESNDRSPDSGPSKEFVADVTSYCEGNNTDLYLYSGSIAPQYAHSLIEKISIKSNRKKAVSVFLTTHGGDPHSGYRIARCLQQSYEHIRLLIAGPCKSAGTLITVGADQIAFGIHGQLGPLDMQIRKQDELWNNSSGLDTIMAFDSIKSRTYDCFVDFMFDTLRGSQGAISTKMASEIASQLSIGLISPISGQIDPHQLGEVLRSMNIGTEYAQRLNKGNTNNDHIAKLVEGFPAHGFVIDEEEARTMFIDVEHFSESEHKIYKQIESPLIDPNESPLVADLGALIQESTDNQGSDTGLDDSDKRETGDENHDKESDDTAKVSQLFSGQSEESSGTEG